MTKVSRSFVTRAATVRAVREVSLTARPGQFLCLHGPSGSGKTTLLNLIAGLDAPDTGEIRIGGVALGGLGASARARLRLETVGVVFRQDRLIEEFTALENVALPLEARGVGSATAFRKARGLLERVGLGEAAGRLPRRLTGGQRQRVGIARALAGDRRVLLADDPTGALDPAAAREVFALVRQLCGQGVLAVVCSPDPRCREYADAVAELVDGRLTTFADTPRAAI